MRHCLPLLLATFWLANASAQTMRFERQKPCMGTTLRLVTHSAMPEQTVFIAFDQAFARAEALNRILSDYIADSELMRLCARSGTEEAVTVGPELFEVLSAAQKMSLKTEGAFDITVGPLTREWRLARKSFRLPDEETLAAGREFGHAIEGNDLTIWKVGSQNLDNLGPHLCFLQCAHPTPAGHACAPAQV